MAKLAPHEFGKSYHGVGYIMTIEWDPHGCVCLFKQYDDAFCDHNVTWQSGLLVSYGYRNLGSSRTLCIVQVCDVARKNNYNDSISHAGDHSYGVWSAEQIIDSYTVGRDMEIVDTGIYRLFGGKN